MGEEKKESFKAIETQEELNNIIQNRLNKQKESYEKKLNELNTILDEKNKMQEELNNLKVSNTEEENVKENLLQENKKLQDEVSLYKLNDLKRKIAIENGINYELASRLQGNTEEEIRKDAQSLSQLVKPSNKVAPLKDIENKKEEKSSYSELLENLKLKGE